MPTPGRDIPRFDPRTTLPGLDDDHDPRQVDRSNRGPGDGEPSAAEGDPVVASLAETRPIIVPSASSKSPAAVTLYPPFSEDKKSPPAVASTLQPHAPPHVPSSVERAWNAPPVAPPALQPSAPPSGAPTGPLAHDERPPPSKSPGASFAAQPFAGSKFEVTQPSTAMLRELEAMRHRKSILIAAAIGCGLALLAVVIAVVVARSGHEPQVDAPGTSDSASASASAPAQAASPAASAATAVAEPKPMRPCAYKGPRKRLVLGASKDVPLEMWASQDRPGVAVGFGTNTGMAVGFVLDLGTMIPERTFTKKTTAPLRRLVPAPSGDGIAFHVDVDEPAEALRERLSVPTSPWVQLGTFKQSLTLAAEKTTVPEILWQLPSDEPVEAMRAVAVPNQGFAVVFRMAQGVWLGWVDASRKAQGDLKKIPGSGERVGAPSIGWNGREALIAFADQPSSTQPWSIRIARAPVGQMPDTSVEWTVPAGGPGGGAMAPSILGMKDGRWLIVWTEGKAGSRDVRLQTYTPSLEPIGEAFTVSQPGANAGQGVVAVGSQGGAVSYLSIVGTLFEVWGASITCP